MSRWWIRLASGLSSWAVMAPLGFAAALPAGAQAPVPEGGEFQVNTYTTNIQYRPSVATEADGGFVVVWHSYGSSGTDTSGSNIQGQRHASDGSTQGAQFQVNTFTTGGQKEPSVATEADGDFVVVWGSDGSSPPTNHSIQGQRYASDGSTRGAQFQVNTYPGPFQSGPSVATDADGDIVVVWDNLGSPGTDASGLSVQGQRYASDGSAQGAQFQVNTDTSKDQGLSSVAADADGDFVVAWVNNSGLTEPPFMGVTVHGQRYASDGSKQGAQFQVNTYATIWQYHPSMATNPDGDFVVAWDSSSSPETDSSAFSIQARIYSSTGAALGPQFQVNTYTSSEQRYPSVATDPDGSFVVVWQSQGSAGTDTGVTVSTQGQRYSSDGSAQGAQFQVNTYTTSAQDRPSVAADAGGDFVVVWQSAGSFGTDTSSRSIQGQRYSVPAPVSPVPAMSPATRFALGAALMLLGAAYALSRRS